MPIFNKLKNQIENVNETFYYITIYCNILRININFLRLLKFFFIIDKKIHPLFENKIFF